jgi:hypothetical protein
MDSPLAASTAVAAAWACRLNAPADPIMASANSRIDQVRSRNTSSATARPVESSEKP